MAKLTLKTNNTFDTIVTVRESDPYSRQVYVKIESDSESDGLKQLNELFLNPSELVQLGEFLIDQAGFVRANQQSRNFAKIRN